VARIYFAWVNGNETTFQPTHKREDEDVVSLNLEQAEGDFASLSVTIKNPRIGFLHATRKQWVWLSVDDTPLFFGRVIGIPASINKEAVTVEFQGRPADFQDQKEALAATMRDLPFYDPVWFTPEAQLDPDTVLEARPQRWHIDRVTGEVTASNVLVGEDGLQDFPESEIPYDSVDININQVPARTIHVIADVGWTQTASGTMAGKQFILSSYTGKSLIDKWPKLGDDLGGGWYVSESSIQDNYNIENLEAQSFSIQWSSEAQKHFSGDTVSVSESITTVPALVSPGTLGTDPAKPGNPVTIPLTSATKSAEGEATTQSTSLLVPEYAITARIGLGYNASRGRKESVEFLITANFQDLLTLPGDESVEYLSISGGDVGVAMPLPGGEYGETEVPLGDARLGSYFTTARGLRSLEWVILRARAQMVLASRAVEVTCTIPWERAIELSCRMNGRIHDRHLPGGVATGKIVKYGFSSDGDSATRIGTVTIACSIGFGGTVAPVAGEPDYCDDDYVEADYQLHNGEVVVLGDSDIGYSPPELAVGGDDGVTFPLHGRTGIKAMEIVGSQTAQLALLNGLQADIDVSGIGKSVFEQREVTISRADSIPKAIEEGLKGLAQYLHLRMINLNSGPFESTYVVNLTQLELPKGIDLEAASS
jgi:hypothetical protein